MNVLKIQEYIRNRLLYLEKQYRKSPWKVDEYWARIRELSEFQEWFEKGVRNG